jgi:hypothetical protein
MEGFIVVLAELAELARTDVVNPFCYHKGVDVVPSTPLLV